MTERTTEVRNDAGIHCRPSSEIVAAAGEFKGCKLRVKTDKGDSDLSSILSLITLGLMKGDTVTVVADGDGEEEACEKIASLFAFHFDFPDKNGE